MALCYRCTAHYTQHAFRHTALPQGILAIAIWKQHLWHTTPHHTAPHYTTSHHTTPHHTTQPSHH